MAISSKPADIRLEVGVDVGASFNSMKEDITGIIRALNKQTKKIKLDFDLSSASRQLNSIQRQISEIRKNASGIKVGATSVSGGGGKSRSSKAAKAAAAAALTARWQSQGITEGNIKSLFGKAEKNQNLFENFDELRNRYQEVIRLHEEWKRTGSSTDEAVTKPIEEATEALKKYIEAELSAANAAAKQEQNDINRFKQLQKISELQGRIAKNQNDWTRARSGKSKDDYENLKKYNNELEELAQKVRNGSMTTKEFDRAFADINMRYKQSANNIKGVGENTKTLSDRMKGLATKFSAWLSVSQVIMFAVRTVKKMISTAIELESAMTQLRIVTNATDAEMKRFSDTAFDLAKKLGKSTPEVLKSIETFSRLGYSLKDASKLSEYATILSNVANVSNEEATTGLTSIIKGYDLKVEDAEHVADLLVSVGQSYAVSASEMMEAYEKSGAALNATNTSLEKSAGLIAAANASVQDSSVVGTALKTVSARIRGKKFCASVYSNIHAQARQAA